MDTNAQPCKHGLDLPECPVCSPVSYDDKPPFLYASGPWETANVWKCDDCGAHGDAEWDIPQAARDHVTAKGHTVILTKTAEMTLFPVTTKPPG